MAQAQSVIDYPAKVMMLEQTQNMTQEHIKELKSDVREFRNDYKADMREFNQHIREIRKDMQNEYKVHSTRSWMQFGFIFSMISTVLGILARAEGWL